MNIPEEKILARYARKMEAAPLHIRNQRVQKMTRENVYRCLSQEAPDNLARMFAGRADDEMLCNELNSFEEGRTQWHLGNKEYAMTLLHDAYQSGENRAIPYLAEYFLEEKEYENALRCFQLLALNLGQSEYLEKLADCSLKLGDANMAIYYYELARTAGYKKSYTVLGELYAETDQQDKAAKLYEEEILAGNYEAFLAFVCSHEIIGDVDRAIAELKNKIGKKGQADLKLAEGRFLFLRGKVCMNEPQSNDGIDMMFAAVFEDKAEKWEALYHTLVKENLWFEAEMLCKKAIQRKQPAYAKLGHALIKQSKMVEAERACKKGSAKGESECDFLLGVINEKRNQPSKAMNFFNKAADGKVEQAYGKLAMLNLGTGDLETARINFECAMQTGEKEHVILKYLSFLIDLGDIETAKTVFVEAIKMGKPEKDLKRVLEGSEIHVAAKLVLAAAQFDPEKLFWMAQIYLNDRDPDAACAYMDLAVSMGVSGARQVFAKFLAGRGLFDKARKQYEAALKEKEDCFFDYAALLEKGREFELAIYNYRMAIDMEIRKS